MSIALTPTYTTNGKAPPVDRRLAQSHRRMRQSAAFWRRVALESIIQSGGYEPGDYARWADELGVSRATICRDVRRLYEHG